MEVYDIMFKYIHIANANVEENERYLSDVVRVTMEEDQADGKFRVVAFPVVQDGVETVQVPPVYPETETKTVERPTYAVPTTLTKLVRAQGEEFEYGHGWTEVEVTVSAIADEKFDTFEEAEKYYVDLEHQLSQGDKIRHVRRNMQLRDSYDTNNSRYPSY